MGELRQGAFGNMEQNPVKLNLACGMDYREGYINIDNQFLYGEGFRVDVKADLFDLRWDENSVEEIQVLHFLPYVHINQVSILLKRWYSWLKDGGKIVIEAGDTKKVARNILDSNDPEVINGSAGVTQLFGLNISLLHKWSYSPDTLGPLLAGVGFKDIEFSDGGFHGRPDRDFTMTGYKKVGNLITVVYPYYGQDERIPGIIEEKHPESRIIIIDDCFPEPLKPIDGIDIYRIEDDILWNHSGAANLGFHVSYGWIVFSCIDHLVTRENIDSLLDMEKEKGTVYRLAREDQDGTRGLSPTIFLIHKDDFESIGGFDEDFAGHYGYDDFWFWKRCEKFLKIIELYDITVKDFSKESYSKAVERDPEYNLNVYLKKAEDPEVNTGERLRFKWNKVE